MAIIWKKGLFWPTFPIFSHQGKDTIFQHISHFQKYAYFAHPIDIFALLI